MRSTGERGFTLIELMTTTVLVGVLSVLASYGVRTYAAHSKTAEAVNMVGAIGMAVKATFYRDHTSSGVLKLGQSSTLVTGGTKTGGGSKGKGAVVTHNPSLCDDSQPVPVSLTSVKGRKYQPSNAPGKDYASGGPTSGWQCLHFTSDQPQYYQYQFLSSGHVSVALPHGGEPPGLSRLGETNVWMAVAQGDLDGDGVTSFFALYGAIDGNDRLLVAPDLDIVSEDD